jgi:hypothetical protein
MKILNFSIIFIIIILNISLTKTQLLSKTECYSSDSICTAIDLNSHCLSEKNLCECNSDYFFNSTLNKCKYKYYLNISCSNDNDCSKFEKNGICDGFGSCVCEIGFSWNFENFTCEFNSEFSIENLLCGENNEICVKKDENSFCHNFYCKCNENFIYNSQMLKCSNNINYIKFKLFNIMFIMFMFMIIIIL